MFSLLLLRYYVKSLDTLLKLNVYCTLFLTQFTRPNECAHPFKTDTIHDTFDVRINHFTVLLIWRRHFQKNPCNLGLLLQNFISLSFAHLPQSQVQ